MLASHGKEHPGDFWIFADVLKECLANIVAKRDIVFGFARNFAAVTAKASSGVDKPPVFFSVVGSLHSLLPVFLWLKKGRRIVSLIFVYGGGIGLGRCSERTCCCDTSCTEELSAVLFFCHLVPNIFCFRQVESSFQLQPNSINTFDRL